MQYSVFSNCSSTVTVSPSGAVGVCVFITAGVCLLLKRAIKAGVPDPKYAAVGSKKLDPFWRWQSWPTRLWNGSGMPGDGRLKVVLHQVHLHGQPTPGLRGASSKRPVAEMV